jgi:hypothetical protein
MSDTTKKVLWTIGLWIPSAAVSVILRHVFQAWGLFDPFSEWLGGWLKMHVSPAQVEWTVAGIISLAGYAALLWVVWKYHRFPQLANTELTSAVSAVAAVPETSRYMTAYEVIHYIADDSKWVTRSDAARQGRFQRGLER